jgi:predicted RNase H-like nuclease (RuvC/YqgF family)
MIKRGNTSKNMKSKEWMSIWVLGGTNSNGHGEGKDDNMNMVETIRKLQKYVQSQKSDNESLMKAKEQHEDFNLKLMQSLDTIENKLYKESGFNKSGRHKFPDEKRRTKSGRRPHRHS